VPTEGINAATEKNKDFGTSSFYGQQMAKKLPNIGFTPHLRCLQAAIRLRNGLDRRHEIIAHVWTLMYPAGTVKLIKDKFHVSADQIDWMTTRVPLPGYFRNTYFLIFGWCMLIVVPLIIVAALLWSQRSYWFG
jgi:hypothetical protein